MSMAVQLGVVPPFSFARKSSSSWFNSKQRSPNTSAFFMVKAKPNLKTNNYSTIISNYLDKKSAPWLMLPPETDHITGEKFDRFYSVSDSQIVMINREKNLKIPDTAICKCSTLGSWLFFADTKDGSLYLSNPYLNDAVELPSLGTLPRVVGLRRDPHGSILHFKVAFPDYKGPWDSGDVDAVVDVEPERMARDMISQIALSHNDPRDFDCVAMAVQGDMARLAYSHIGQRIRDDDDDDEKVWYGLQEDYSVTSLSDQLVYNSKHQLFYSIDGDGIKAYDVMSDRGRRSKKVDQLYMVDIHRQCKQGLPKWLENKLKSGNTGHSRLEHEYYLLTLSNGDLWLIVRYVKKYSFDNCITSSYETLHFEVFRVAYPGDLERVTYLEDRAIFIGSNQSFYVEVGESGDASSKIRANCIYFTNDIYMDDWKFDHDMGIFNMKNGNITKFYPYQDEEEKEVPFTAPCIWIAPLESRYF